MARLLLVAAAWSSPALLLVSCNRKTSVSFEVLAQSPLAGDGSPLKKAAIVLARSMEGFGKLADFIPIKTTKEVAKTNFQTHFLLLLVAGGRDSSGYEVLVESVTYNRSTGELNISYTVPGPEATKSGGDPEITYPCAVLRLPRGAWPTKVICHMDGKGKSVETFLEGYKP